MAFTLAQAAAACGLNRTTILRSIKSGKISGTRDINGAWQVEPAELHRIFPACAPAQGAPKVLHQVAQAPALFPDADAHQRAALAEERLSDLKAMLADMKDQRDKWQAQAERLALAAPLTTPAPAPARSWWKRLAG
jgi:hypothetical protein